MVMPWLINFRRFFMTSTTRRRFIEIIPLAGVTLMAACSKTPEPAPVAPPPAPPMPAPPPEPPPAPAPAAETAPASAPGTSQAPEAAAPATSTGAMPMVDPKGPQALALGYVDDATHADKVKYPKYAAGNQCSNCALYQGKAGDAAGACPLFPGKHVAVQGWCSAWVKKA